MKKRNDEEKERSDKEQKLVYLPLSISNYSFLKKVKSKTKSTININSDGWVRRVVL